MSFYITAGSTHTNETAKPSGATSKHGKTLVHSRSDAHEKTAVAHGTTKKTETHKSRTIKKPEQDKSDPEKDDHTGTLI